MEIWERFSFPGFLNNCIQSFKTNPHIFTFAQCRQGRATPTERHILMLVWFVLTPFLLVLTNHKDEYSHRFGGHWAVLQICLHTYRLPQSSDTCFSHTCTASPEDSQSEIHLGLQSSCFPPTPPAMHKSNKIVISAGEFVAEFLCPHSYSGEESVHITVPDTITTWKAMTFCTSQSKGFGLSPTVGVTAFKPFFVDLTLPYSVVRGESFRLTATIFNYLKKCIRVRAGDVGSRYPLHWRHTHLPRKEDETSVSWPSHLPNLLCIVCFTHILYNFLKLILVNWFILAVLGLCCHLGSLWEAFSSCSEWGLLFIVVRKLLIVVATLVSEHRLHAGFSSCIMWAQWLWLLGSRAQVCGAWSQWPLSTWDLPRLAIKPVSAALAGGFLTAGPPEKSYSYPLSFKYPL